MTHATLPRLAIVGGGPAGLMAAETARAAGVAVDVYDAMGSVGRKFLLAGKGGLNLTHGEPFARFVERYGERRDEVARWLQAFDADALRDWARGLGVETFVGSSGRVFPVDMKAAPLLRRWLHRLRGDGVAFHMHHRWLGWTEDDALRFATPEGECLVAADATVLALGGASWPRLGSDGAWVAMLQAAGIDLAPLQSANCGFEVAWSEHLRTRFAGAPLKAVVAHWVDRHGVAQARQGECVLSEYGIEGSLVYAIGADLRERIARAGAAALHLDLAPGLAQMALAERLAAPRGKTLNLAPMKTLVIDAGRQDKLRPGDILGALTGDAGLDAKDIGKIDVYATRAYVAIGRALANKALERLRAGRIKGRNFRVRPLG